MGKYLIELTLTELHMFNATDNMFDKDAVKQRIKAGIGLWLVGNLGKPQYPSWMQTRAVFGEIREWVQQQGIFPPENPTPPT